MAIYDATSNQVPTIGTFEEDGIRVTDQASTTVGNIIKRKALSLYPDYLKLDADERSLVWYVSYYVIPMNIDVINMLTPCAVLA